MIAAQPAWLHQPSIAQARRYLAKHRGALRAQYDAFRFERRGYALYFTVLASGARMAVVVKVCENPSGVVTGSSSVSDGEPSC
jgi:hypothetical protein